MSRSTGTAAHAVLRTRATRVWFTATASLAAVGTLVGCSASDGDATAAEDGDATTATSAGAPVTATDFTDGSYTAVGDYVSPAGQQSIEVTLTLASNVVEDVNVVAQAQDPQSEGYQEKFISGISEQVVGVPISELAVDKVAGSSLTSIGFNDAIAQIMADAAA